VDYLGQVGSESVGFPALPKWNYQIQGRIDGSSRECYKFLPPFRAGVNYRQEFRRRGCASGTRAVTETTASESQTQD
jgi:hypothetical protein